MREALLAALEEAVARLNARAEEAYPLDPLREITYFVRADEARIEAVAQYMSGHGPESAHVLEDRVVFEVNGRELRELQFERNLGLADPETLVLADDGAMRAFVARVEGFLAEALP